MAKRVLSFCFGLALSLLVLLSSVGVAQAQTSEKIWRTYAYSQWFEGPLNSGVCSNLFAEMSKRDSTAQRTYTYTFTGMAGENNGRDTCKGNQTIFDVAQGKNVYEGSNLNLANIESITCSGATPRYSYVTHSCAANPDPPKCEAGKTGSGRWQAGTNDTTVATNGGCVAGCHVQMTGVQSCWGPSSGVCTTGQCSCVFNYTTSGQTCTAGSGSPGTVPEPSPPQPRKDVPPIKPPPGKSCPAGTVQAGVDSAGTPICMGTGTDPKNAPPPPPKIESEKTEQKPDGSTVTTKTETVKNSDGSTTTTTTTTTRNPDGTTSTDVKKDVSNTPAGDKGKDESTKDNEKYDLCKQNPMLTICRNSSVSGKCGEIACEGDAIQCATLRAAAAMQCQQDADKKALEESPLKSVGQQIIDGADPQKTAIDSMFKGREIDMSKQALDEAGFVGGGSCFPDKSINVLGKTITVSFARVCQDIQPLRAAIMACAFIVAYLIVSKSVLQG